MATTDSKEQAPMFDVDALRKVVGLVALVLPLIVSWRSSTPLTSISASYHTEAQDIFVGALFIIGALIWAYQGHTVFENVVSKLAAVAAIVAALYPTACDACTADTNSMVHYFAAAVLFSATAYFCLFAFMRQASKKREKGEKDARTAEKKGEDRQVKAALKTVQEATERIVLYWICGLIIVVCLVAALLGNYVLSDETRQAWRFVYRVEFVALWAFGLAWLVAGKVITWVSGKIHIRIW